MIPLSFRKLVGHGYNLVKRGNIEVKGKGIMKTYLLLGNKETPDLLTLTDELRKKYIKPDDDEEAPSGDESRQSASLANATDAEAGEDATRRGLSKTNSVTCTLS